MSTRAEEWITVAAWLTALHAQVVEADAAMQVRQRLAWQEFQRALAPTLPFSVAEGIDRDRNLGIREIQLKARLEALPSGPIARAVRALRRLFRRPVPPPNAYRIATPRTRADRRIEITMTVSRDAEGAWRSATASTPDMPLESSYVPHAIA
jgi:hypothetical protein